MGQQQLLLLVLSTVIVGFSIVLGLDAYTATERNARKEMANTKMAEIAGRAIGWRNTPKTMQGGRNTDGTSSFEGFELSELGISEDPYLFLPDGSCISCVVRNGGQQLDIQWQPNGDCESGSDVLFKLEVTGTELADITYVTGDYTWDQ
ncbi:MAG: hypothetical protein KTR29_21790 [Rhodothermaceae bacterium]|nr:hypothetical protein [Rhodothermaceae bacterium]